MLVEENKSECVYARIEKIILAGLGADGLKEKGENSSKFNLSIEEIRKGLDVIESLLCVQLIRDDYFRHGEDVKGSKLLESIDSYLVSPADLVSADKEDILMSYDWMMDSLEELLKKLQNNLEERGVFSSNIGREWIDIEGNFLNITEEEKMKIKIIFDLFVKGFDILQWNMKNLVSKVIAEEDKDSALELPEESNLLTSSDIDLKANGRDSFEVLPLFSTNVEFLDDVIPDVRRRAVNALTNFNSVLTDTLKGFYKDDLENLIKARNFGSESLVYVVLLNLVGNGKGQKINPQDIFLNSIPKELLTNGCKTHQFKSFIKEVDGLTVEEAFDVLNSKSERLMIKTENSVNNWEPVLEIFYNAGLLQFSKVKSLEK